MLPFTRREPSQAAHTTDDDEMTRVYPVSVRPPVRSSVASRPSIADLAADLRASGIASLGPVEQTVALTPASGVRVATPPASFVPPPPSSGSLAPWVAPPAASYPSLPGVSLTQSGRATAPGSAKHTLAVVAAACAFVLLLGVVGVARLASGEPRAAASAARAPVAAADRSELPPIVNTGVDLGVPPAPPVADPVVVPDQPAIPSPAPPPPPAAKAPAAAAPAAKAPAVAPRAAAPAAPAAPKADTKAAAAAPAPPPARRATGASSDEMKMAREAKELADKQLADSL